MEEEEKQKIMAQTKEQWQKLAVVYENIENEYLYIKQYFKIQMVPADLSL